MTNISVIIFAIIAIIAIIFTLSPMNGKKEKDINWMQGCCLIVFLLIVVNTLFASIIFKQQYDQGQKDALNGKQKFHKVMIEQIQVIEKKKE